MPYDLTDRELQVLRLAAGHTDREIGRALFITVDAVEKHLRNIQAKVGVASRDELVQRVKDEGLA